jgi:hypothetical protein
MVPGVGSSSEKRTTDRPSSGEWLVNVADDVVVPMTTLEVIDGLRTGRLFEQSLVWRIGMHDWTSIADVPQLRLAAGSRIPPPTVARVTQPPLVAPAEAPGPATLPQKSLPSTMPNSLAPITAEASAEAPALAPGTWPDLEQLLSDERRADQRSSRRVVLWAALGSAALASVFALWLVRAPAPREPAPAPAQAAQPSEAPVLAPTLEAVAAPSESEPQRAGADSRVAPRSAAPHLNRHPKRAPPAASASDARRSLPATLAGPDRSAASANPAVVPLSPLEPAPAVSTSPEAPALASPIAPAPAASP